MHSSDVSQLLCPNRLHISLTFVTTVKKGVELGQKFLERRNFILLCYSKTNYIDVTDYLGSP